jgi:hypothetical protein
LKEIQISICGNHTSCLVNLITTILIDTNSSFQTRCNRMLLFDQLDHGKFDQPRSNFARTLQKHARVRIAQVFSIQYRWSSHRIARLPFKNIKLPRSSLPSLACVEHFC